MWEMMTLTEIRKMMLCYDSAFSGMLRANGQLDACLCVSLYIINNLNLALF